MAETFDDDAPPPPPKTDAEKRMERIFNAMGVLPRLAVVGLTHALKGIGAIANEVIDDAGSGQIVKAIRDRINKLSKAEKDELRDVMNESDKNPFIAENGELPLFGLKISPKTADEIAQTVKEAVNADTKTAAIPLKDAVKKEQAVLLANGAAPTKDGASGYVGIKQYSQALATGRE